jgi:peptide-methionine (S)-S-oxide reductase
MDVAIFGGGCFWCLEAAFAQLKGVESAISGYCGGRSTSPTYEEVCSGASGHAEVVRVEYDPGLISYRQLLEVFFAIHDPTTLNRQGADVGTQYRSAIFVTSEAQRRAALETVACIAKAFGAAVVTEVVDAAPFHPAEEYHQDYFGRNPGQGYCAFVIAPKMAEFRRRFSPLLSVPG